MNIKPVIQDIKPPKSEKQSVGPVEELEKFTIIDFRRMSSSIELAGKKVLDKFETLKHDSYLLFMDGVEAWYNSPIYKNYQYIISQSLKQNKTVENLIVDLDFLENLKLAEFKEVIKINNKLN